VPDPAAMMREMKRVCRPGGDLFVINHFSRDDGPIAACERMISPISKLVGFRTSFPLGEFLSTAELDSVDIEPVNLFGYWKLLHARNV
jgi:phosphatidylethanolamine/phosphatidyl-N-methylethanolamine N-methyltransferase